MKTTLVMAAAVSGLLCIPASAADLLLPIAHSPEVFAQTSAFDWSGFYVGASVGAGIASSNSGAEDRTSPGAALMAGYNHDFNSFVGGIRAEFIPTGLTDVTVDTRTLGHSGRLVATAGAKLGNDGSTLAYGLAGIAAAHSTEGDEDFLDFGWTVGAGVSQAVTDSVSVFGEVGYTRFDDVADTTVDVDGLGAAIGVAYHF